MIEKFTLDRILAGVLGCLLCIQIFLLLPESVKLSYFFTGTA